MHMRAFSELLIGTLVSVGDQDRLVSADLLGIVDL